MNVPEASSFEGPTHGAERPGRVLVAMSGGVDSSVAAALLREQGWEVAGVTFKLFCYGETEGSSRACCGLEGVRDAQAVARRLGIPHTVLDREELFRETVLADFAAEYGRGRTPNPCVQCNTHVKFGPLLGWARENGFDRIATGHYVSRAAREIGGASHVLLARPRDVEKDQTYVLWGVDPAVLERTLFPLGSLRKGEARELARRWELPVWDKEESQDICFVDGRGYAEVLREQLGEEHPLFRPGPIVGRDGRRLGTHAGLARYTVGQRRGLGLTHPRPLHVLELDPETNSLVVGEAEDLAVPGCRVEDVHAFVPLADLESGPVEAKIRYRHAPTKATVRCTDSGLEVEFAVPQRAVSPGQSCVLYRDDAVLAGGRIVAPTGQRGARQRGSISVPDPAGFPV